MKGKNFLSNFLSGIGIGIGASIPGVSGATISVIFHSFERIVWAINGIFKHLKQSLLILFPLLLGVVGALIPCFILFDLAFESFAFGLVCIFAGFIIGSFSNITKEVKEEKIKPFYWVLLALGIIIALGLGVVSVVFGDAIDIESHFLNPEWYFYLIMIPIGMIAAMALVVPGISGSMIMLVLGIYVPLINQISNAIKGDFSNIVHLIGILGCMAVGIILGFLTIAKFLSFLLKKYRTATFYAIIGFIIGSTIALFFNHKIATYYIEWFEKTDAKHWLPMYIEIPLGAVLMGLSTFVSYKLIKKAEKTKEQEKEKKAV